MGRPLTYGDLLPGLLAWSDRQPPSYGKSIVEMIREGQRASNRLFARALAQSSTKENDPMNITIRMREIANGVLVTAHGQYGADLTETFFPDWTTACSDLPGIAAAVLEKAQDATSVNYSVPQEWAAEARAPIEDDGDTTVYPPPGFTIGGDIGKDAICGGPHGTEFGELITPQHSAAQPDYDKLGIDDAESHN